MGEGGGDAMGDASGDGMGDGDGDTMGDGEGDGELDRDEAVENATTFSLFREAMPLFATFRSTYAATD